jgi:hypothetical protein
MAQRETYGHILEGTLRAHLLGDAATPEERSEEEKVDVDADAPIQLRKRSGKERYTVDGDDDGCFGMLGNGEIGERGLRHEAEKLKPGEAYKKYERRVKCKILPLCSEATYRPFLLYSYESQQHEVTKRDHATSKSLLASLPLRPAFGPDDVATRLWASSSLTIVEK